MWVRVGALPESGLAGAGVTSTAVRSRDPVTPLSP